MSTHDTLRHSLPDRLVQAAAAGAMPLPLPVAGFEVRSPKPASAPVVEQPFDVPQLIQEVQEGSLPSNEVRASWIGRQSLRFSEWAAEQNTAGRTNLLMWGVSTWPYLWATFSQMALLGVRTAGNYQSVRQSGFTGMKAVILAARWNFSYTPVERSLPPLNWALRQRAQSLGKSLVSILY